MFQRLLMIFTLFALSSLALGQNMTLGNFAGKYKINVIGHFNSDEIELLINSKGETKLIKYKGDEALGIPVIFCHVESYDNELGPQTLPIANLTLVFGSDEETHAFVFRMAFVNEDRASIVLLDKVYTINDGPNDVASVEKAEGKIFRWNKLLDKYELIPGI